MNSYLSTSASSLASEGLPCLGVALKPLAGAEAVEFEDTNPATALSGADTTELLSVLRSACIAARKVLCESVLNDKLDEAGATNVINDINTALVRSSCLD